MVDKDLGLFGQSLELVVGGQALVHSRRSEQAENLTTHFTREFYTPTLFFDVHGVVFQVDPAEYAGKG